MSNEFQNAFEAFMVAAQERVNADYMRFSAGYPNAKPPVLVAEHGKRYVRIVSDNGVQRSAWGFVDTTNGDVLKSAGWKSPAKNFARGNIHDQNKGCGRAYWTSVQ